MAKFDLIYFYLSIKNKISTEQVLAKLKTVFTHLNCNLTIQEGKQLNGLSFFFFPVKIISPPIHIHTHTCAHINIHERIHRQIYIYTAIVSSAANQGFMFKNKVNLLENTLVKTELYENCHRG